MHPYEPVDDLSPTTEQEAARRALWRRADRLARDTLPGVPPDAPPPRRSRSRPPINEIAPLDVPHLPRARPYVAPARRPTRGARRSRGRWLLLVGALFAAALAATCTAAMDRSAVMAEYGEPTPVSTAAAADVFSRGATALQELPDSGLLRVTLTEEEATSALGLGLMLPELVRAMETVSPDEIGGTASLDEIRRRLRTRVLASDATSVAPTTLAGRLAALLDPRLAVEEAQVRFSDSGNVVLAGSIRAWRWRQPALAVVMPTVEEGRLRLDFARVQLGRILAPTWLFDRLARVVPPERILGARYTELTQLEVGDGTLTLEGRIE